MNRPDWHTPLSRGDLTLRQGLEEDLLPACYRIGQTRYLHLHAVGACRNEGMTISGAQHHDRADDSRLSP